MPTIRVLAPAKVNLTFDIKGTLPDGYHQVETLMQAIDLQDDLTVSVQPADEFQYSITCVNDVIPKNFPFDDSNLMVKAARLFFMEAEKRDASINSRQQLTISLEKNIPIGAGLAGGSADGAGVLVALNQLFGQPFSTGELCELGKKLGADVPFCIAGGTAIGTHRGDVLASVDNALEFSFCIVKPRHLSVSTPWAYQQYDQFSGVHVHPDTERCVQNMRAGDIEAAIGQFGNAFEPVIFSHLSELAPIKQQLLKLGCWTCHLSGSGPALFAVVADREQAHFIRRKVLKTDEFEFEYIRLSTPDLGPPNEFYIAQTKTTGVTIKDQSLATRK